MDTVINIPELFEEILLQLPFLDLNIATGVNHTFRSFILNSRKLQRKLFRLPAPPPMSRKKRKYFDRHGIFGTFLNIDKCLNEGRRKQNQVTLLPFLLEPTCVPDMRFAHLSVRAAEAASWPNMFLTDPPCAHAYVWLVYAGFDEKKNTIVLEAGRSVYKRGGVTLVAINETLSQPGAVTARMGRMKGLKGVLKVHETTMAKEVERVEERYKCKLSMDLAATTIQLHGIPIRSEEVSTSLMPMRGLQGLRGWSSRKLHFED